MKGTIQKLWSKKIFSSILSVSFLLSGISPALNVSAASPASIPDTLKLKESTGVCSGNSTAFNVNSDAFNSSKLRFYQDMLEGHHEKSNASTNAEAPDANASEDWLNIAYILHNNRKSQSGTENYGSRMEAMRYSTIAEYNNTQKIYKNEYQNGYNWVIHRSGLNYSNSLSNADTAIRKKLYEFYLAQHTSGSNKKGWDWNDKSATHSFSALNNSQTQDVFWSILSLNRSNGDNNRRGHGSALIAVFYDFQVNPVLQEDTGTTYIRQRSNGANNNDSFVSSITNNSSQTVNTEYTGSTENTVSHTSNISGSSSYTMGHSVTVGTQVNFGAFASGSVDYTFDYSNTIEKGWSSDDSVSKTERKEDKSSISLPAYSAIKMKRTISNSDEVTSYNCPVILTYKVMLLEHVLNASNDQADAATSTLGIFGKNSISAREDLKAYLTDNKNIKDEIRNVTWNNLANASDTKQAFDYALSNTAQYVPMSSAGATYSVNLKTIHITYDGLISTQPLSRIETSSRIRDINLTEGDSYNVSDIKVNGINAAGTEYIGFNSARGHWILTSASGKEDHSNSIASLTTDRSGNISLKTHKPGTVYLEYVINEDCYSTASAPTAYMTNQKLASTAIIKVNISKKQTSTTATQKKKYTPQKTNLKSIKPAKKSFTITWKKITSKIQKTRIKGYQVQYSTKKNFKGAKTKTINGYKKNRITIKKLKAKKKYYVRIRTLIKIKGKTYYSGWSKVKSIKTK